MTPVTLFGLWSIKGAQLAYKLSRWWHVAVLKGAVVTKYGQNRFRHVGVISWKLWQKKKERNGTNTRPFLVKNDLFDPCDPYMTFDAMLVMWHVAVLEGVVVTKYGQNRFRHVGVISWKLWQKKKETGQIQDPAAASGRVTKKQKTNKKGPVPLTCGWLHYFSPCNNPPLSKWLRLKWQVAESFHQARSHDLFWKGVGPPKNSGPFGLKNFLNLPS